MLKKYFFPILLLLLYKAAVGQQLTPIGTWRYHLPYNSVQTLDIYNGKIYCASSVSSFTYDLSSGELAPLSKLNGLNDIGISKIKTSEFTNTLIIGYSNGNIDLLRGEEIININDIYRKNIVGSKNINHIYCKENLAYISTDFGLVVLNLKTLEVKETYSNLGPSGASSKIYCSLITDDKDSIYIASEHGIMGARYSPAVNLMDYSMWYRFGAADSIVTNGAISIVSYNSKIYAGINNYGIVVFNGTYWRKILSTQGIGTFRALKESNNKLFGLADYRVYLFQPDESYDEKFGLTYPADVIVDSQGKYWFGELQSGLHEYNQTNGSFKSIQLNGPYGIETYKLNFLQNSIYAVPGTFNSVYGHVYREAGYYHYKNGEWFNFRNSQNTFPFAFDIVSIDYNSKNKKTYFGTVGFGLLELSPNGSYKYFTDTNSTLSRNTLGAWETHVSDIEVDQSNIIWIANPSSKSALDPTLHWVATDSIAFPSAWKSKTFGIESARYPLEIIIDSYKNKWIRLGPGKAEGLIVFNENNKNTTWKHLTTGQGKGNLPDPNVHCMVKDKKGEIWIGTNKGVAVFYDPSTVFSNGNYDASTPIVNQYPLLFDQQITCIDVDGGNRKWIGTREGLWLLSEDGTEVVYNFTITNSMLPSNHIMDIEIDDATGEVFIATDKGLISFRGTATESTKQYSGVNIFPNPVKPDFNGLVGISGLASNVNVKITDIFGNLIYETKANGGTAVWNVKDYNGRRANTGIYLIYTASEEGDVSLVSKIAVVE